MKKLIPLLAVIFLSAVPVHGRSIRRMVIDLSGEWTFSTDSAIIRDITSPSWDKVILPGTTDTNRKGTECSDSTVTDHLSRRYSFVGKAWYGKEFTLPRRLRKKSLVLTLERTKSTSVYLDGKEIGSSNDISTSQRFSLGTLSRGRHSLVIMVDNESGVPSKVKESSHMYSEDTQTNWNGIIGVIAISPEGIYPEKKDIRTNRGKLQIKDGSFFYDGRKEFLRGRHDACVFPLTGHTPMDYASWKEYFRKCAQYGLNHVRFHSWCPPEECFRAADEEGFHLQAELPFWGTLERSDTSLVNFLLKEGENILREYSRHPSFSMFSLGNELWGDKTLMQEMISRFREIAPDILYTEGTNAFLGYEGYVEGTDFMSTCRVGGEAYGEYGTHVRSSFSFTDAADGGILNHFPPSTMMDFSEGTRRSPVPVISHESGQFQTYPDFSEISKYTGVLAPHNMEVFRHRLEERGLGDLDSAFHLSSGKLSALLYKADIEMCLRTGDMGGFQLLDLQDYPGQGSAYVGILDAFMDDKGIAPVQWWRQFCSPTVPLALMEKMCWDNTEEFSATVKVANYSGEDFSGHTLRWELSSLEEGGEKISGTLPCPGGEGLLEAGSLSAGLAPFKGNVEAILSVSIEGTDIVNTWNIWIYDSSLICKDTGGILFADKVDKSVLQTLEKGGKVLLMPSEDYCGETTVGGLFQTDYWNFRMFKTISENAGKPVSPGTMGLLIDSRHPLFRHFPTEEHSDWQWFRIAKKARPLILDNFPDGIAPIIRVVDNIERCHSLGLLFEAKVGKGKLLVSMYRPDSAVPGNGLSVEEDHFLSSILRYMQSGEFNPDYALDPYGIDDLFTGKAEERKIGQLGNISYE